MTGAFSRASFRSPLAPSRRSVWSQLPPGMDVHQFGILAVPRNATLSPTAVIEDLTDHREEVRIRVKERADDAAGMRSDLEADLAQHLSHLRATYSPDSCPGCDLFVYCRSELWKSTDPTDLLVELGVKPDVRAQAVGLIDGVTPVGKVASSVRRQLEATVTGNGVQSGQRRLDPAGQPGTVNVVLAKSDGAALGVYGVAVQRVTKTALHLGNSRYSPTPTVTTRRTIMRILGQELNKAIAEQFKANPAEPDPIHLVVPDSDDR